MYALSNLALLLLAERGVPAPTVVAACCLFNITQLALTGGQYLDIGFESRDDVSVEDYLAMIEGKTAALAACSCQMGALIADASEARCESLREFGRNLGLTFQMCDDVLGIWGDPTLTGKPAGADIARRKKSLPILHGLERSEDLRRLLKQDELSTSDVGRATELLERAGSREYTEQLAQEYHGRALAALEGAGLDGPAARALYELEQSLLSREK
jgi:geranylgeranyl diphosphate synthase type I